MGKKELQKEINKLSQEKRTATGKGFSWDFINVSFDIQIRELKERLREIRA